MMCDASTDPSTEDALKKEIGDGGFVMQIQQKA